METEIKPFLIRTVFQVDKVTGYFSDVTLRHIDCNTPMVLQGHDKKGYPQYKCETCGKIFIDIGVNSHAEKMSREQRIEMLKKLKSEGKNYADMARLEGKNYYATIMFCRKYKI